jgi:hypothetical protein
MHGRSHLARTQKGRRQNALRKKETSPMTFCENIVGLFDAYLKHDGREGVESVSR